MRQVNEQGSIRPERLFSALKDSVVDIRVKHEVKLKDYTNWLERTRRIIATRGEQAAEDSIDSLNANLAVAAAP